MQYILYSKATVGGGAYVSSTASGGASVRSTSSGGQSTQTSSSGGGTTQTSSAGGDHYHLMFEAGSSVDHDESMDKEFYANAADGGGSTARVVLGGTIAEALYTRGSSGNHSHNVTVPAHTHSVSVPAHTHDVDIPAHTHGINVPAHTHGIEYGIYELSETATSVEIKVDGNTVPITATSANLIDLIPYLDVDSNGKVNRGWHTISIRPNKMARVTAQVFSQVFIQIRGGGDH